MKWQPTQVFLPGKSHGPWNLVGYSLWGCKESDMTERLHCWLSANAGDMGSIPDPGRSHMPWNS